MDANHLLANQHGIPWRLPADVRHFRNYTEGKWILVGRKTFGEMQGWFRHGHTPVMLTRRIEPDIRAVATVNKALKMVERDGAEELVCCGGAQTYAAALPYANKMVLTVIEERYPADEGAVYFPQWDEKAWHIITETSLPRSTEDEPQARVVVLERVT